MRPVGRDDDRIRRSHGWRGQAKGQRAQNQGGSHFQLSKELRCPSPSKHRLPALVPVENDSTHIHRSLGRCKTLEVELEAYVAVAGPAITTLVCQAGLPAGNNPPIAEPVRGRQIGIGRVDGNAFFNTANIGLSTELAKRFGRLGYAWAAVKVLTRPMRFHAKSIEKGAATDLETYQIAVENGCHYGGGNVVEETADIDDGRLDLYSVEMTNLWKLALMLRAFHSGTHGAWREVGTATCVEFDIETEKPTPVTTDGNIVTSTPAHFKVHLKAISVFAPPPVGIVGRLSWRQGCAIPCRRPRGMHHCVLDDADLLSASNLAPQTPRGHQSYTTDRSIFIREATGQIHDSFGLSRSRCDLGPRPLGTTGLTRALGLELCVMS
nr:hypothetical protein [Mesorhizobium sp. M7A.F.Ca.US.010.02.1.1]